MFRARRTFPFWVCTSITKLRPDGRTVNCVAYQRRDFCTSENGEIKIGASDEMAGEIYVPFWRVKPSRLDKIFWKRLSGE
jgi:hypothetical protein